MEQPPAGAADTAPAQPPAPGTRIRVTAVGAAADESLLRPGAEGMVIEPYVAALAVHWDDRRLNDAGVSLVITGPDPDRYEVLS